MEIIAEIGQNHNGDMALAKELIHAAKENGADVAKFQLYNAKDLFPKKNNEWYDYNLSTELSRENVTVLFEECKAAGIEFMASVFDVERISWLEDLGVDRYKIASRSIHDTPLIRGLVKTGKPLIVSLGMWKETDFPEISPESSIFYLYCVSKYPTPLSDLTFSSVDFTRYHGFSDHTIGITASITAFSRGAGIIEKHFTLDKKMVGPDHSGSMTPDELKALNDMRQGIRACL